MSLMRSCSLVAAMTGNPIVGAFMFAIDFFNERKEEKRQEALAAWQIQNHKQFFTFAFGLDYDLVPEHKYTEVWNRRHGDKCYLQANDESSGEKMVRYYAQVFNLVMQD